LKLTLLPRSLASRTILILLIGFAVIQALGLMIHTFNQIKLEGIEEERDMATRAVIIYRHIAAAPPSQRAALVAKEPLPKGDSITLAAGPPSPGEPEAPLPARQIIRASIFTYGIPPRIRPRGLEIHAERAAHGEGAVHAHADEGHHQEERIDRHAVRHGAGGAPENCALHDELSPAEDRWLCAWPTEVRTEKLV